ncbi:MAG: DsbA family protein [Alphaproteobacteria bacterium]|nr:DsbA family protein [Alphaproteobacteria bacterium]MBU2352425.1 DsbA family protein [Alphaproteobacteria bacterium]MBU2381859.1 DsbA family protein [Alphaproteobacteria bacterium]
MRVAALIGAVLLACAAPVAAQAQAPSVPAVTAADRVMGRADAPVTVIEYASFTCPHCAHWAEEILPAFKARWIDTGQVRLVYRDLPTGPAEPAILAAKLTRCVAAERAFPVIETLFAQQDAARLMRWPPGWFMNALDAGGRPPQQVAACIEDPATEAALNADIDAARAAGVTGTPTFFVNGVRVADPTLQGLASVIDPLLAGR